MAKERKLVRERMMTCMAAGQLRRTGVIRQYISNGNGNAVMVELNGWKCGAQICFVIATTTCRVFWMPKAHAMTCLTNSNG